MQSDHADDVAVASVWALGDQVLKDLPTSYCSVAFYETVI